MNSANNIGHVSCGIKTKLVDFSNKMAPVIVWSSSYRVMFKDTTELCLKTLNRL